jgi:hypothetical protein
MSLDLTVPWNTSAPAWAKLADGPTQEVFPMAFSSDQQILYAFNIPGTNSPWQYNVKNDSWQVSTASFDDAKFKGFQAVTDPRSGYIYIAGGYHHHNFYAPYMKTLDILDPVTQTIHSVDLPAPEQAFPVRWYYGAVWSKYRNSILFWGGKNENGSAPLSPARNVVTELFPDFLDWHTMAGEIYHFLSKQHSFLQFVTLYNHSSVWPCYLITYHRILLHSLNSRRTGKHLS